MSEGKRSIFDDMEGWPTAKRVRVLVLYKAMYTVYQGSRTGPGRNVPNQQTVFNVWHEFIQAEIASMQNDEHMRSCCRHLSDRIAMIKSLYDKDLTSTDNIEKYNNETKLYASPLLLYNEYVDKRTNPLIDAKCILVTTEKCRSCNGHEYKKTLDDILAPFNVAQKKAEDLALGARRAMISDENRKIAHRANHIPVIMIMIVLVVCVIIIIVSYTILTKKAAPPKLTTAIRYNY